MKEKLTDRLHKLNLERNVLQGKLNEIDTLRPQVIANINAYNGAISEVEGLLKEMDANVVPFPAENKVEG